MHARCLAVVWNVFLEIRPQVLACEAFEDESSPLSPPSLSATLGVPLLPAGLVCRSSALSHPAPSPREWDGQSGEGLIKYRKNWESLSDFLRWRISVLPPPTLCLPPVYHSPASWRPCLRKGLEIHSQLPSFAKHMPHESPADDVSFHFHVTRDWETTSSNDSMKVGGC